MIRLSETYGIMSDEKSYVLVKLRRNMTGKKVGQLETRPFGYYRTLDQALEAWGQAKIKEKLSEKDMTLSEAIEAIRQSNKEVRDLIRKALHGEEE